MRRVLAAVMGLLPLPVATAAPFLPLGLAQALKELLGDAKITDWEHRHFVEALGKDALLTATQKRNVQRLVDAWFEQDSGVA